MYLALNGALLGGRVGWPELAELAARAGYAGLEIPLSAAMQGGLQATRSLLYRLQLRPAAANLPVNFRQDEPTFRAGLQQLPVAADFAARLGCHVMTTWIMSSTDRPPAEERKIFRERLSTCAEVLNDYGLRLALEFLGPLHLRQRFKHPFVYRMADMLEFARECGPNVGLLLDSWHWHHAGATVDDILAAGQDGILHVHLADAPDLPPEKILDNERLMPGEGVIDWLGFFGALRQIGYQGALSPEVFGRGLKDMKPEDAARLGASYTLSLAERFGLVLQHPKRQSD